MISSQVASAQAPLRAQYRTDPTKAMVTDHAVAAGGTAADPFHSVVRPMPRSGAELSVGVHRAIGGPHDAPTPGDILCAALAACQDSAVRMAANALGVELEYLKVEVSGDVDVRGTMLIDNAVPVGFQKMSCDVQLRARKGTRSELLEKLRSVAERICVVQQTLRNPPQVRTTFDMNNAGGVLPGA